MDMANGPSFIAVKCYQCSTMQVKQEKKSSNKWRCVICNEKQSVQRIFARSSLAKDVRAIVQKSNAARQHQETNPLSLLDGFQVDTRSMWLENGLQGGSGKAGTPLEWTKPVGEKTRIDWSEYLVVEEDANTVNQGSMLEAEFVTELPQEMMKPKPKRKFSSPFYGAKENTLPSSSCKRRKDPINQHDGNRSKSGEGLGRQKSASKWSDYLEMEYTDEDASGRLPSNCGEHSYERLEFETHFVDQKVDEDIHPDFK